MLPRKLAIQPAGTPVWKFATYCMSTCKTNDLSTIKDRVRCYGCQAAVLHPYTPEMLNVLFIEIFLAPKEELSD